MKRLFEIILLVFFTCQNLFCQEAIIIDHNCTDLSKIPMTWIDSIQQNMKMHFAHTSHGSQLITGLTMIENTVDSAYSFSRKYCALPEEAGAFCIFDGQEDDSYISPEDYWSTNEGMRQTGNVLTHNPEINASMWSWCTQMSLYDSSDVMRYIDSMNILEQRYPEVHFIYMTGHLDGTGAPNGNNLRASNRMLRNYCVTHGKVLFDFEDIESRDPEGNYFENDSDVCEWCTSWCDSHPNECPDCEECPHSHCFNCFQKGKAFWWIMARLAGWNDKQTDITYNTASICKGDSVLLESAYQKLPDTYYDTLTNTSMVDSVIVTELYVYPKYTMERENGICYGDSIILGGTFQTKPGIYHDMFTSVAGCDSVIVTELYVFSEYTIEREQSICSGDSIKLGGTLQVTSGIYKDVFNSVNGCDSIVNTTLSVISVDTTITLSENTLVAMMPNGEYQWIDCDTNQPVPGENGRSFTAESGGYFAVKITQNSCIQMSDCYLVTPLGFNDFRSINKPILYPNPSNQYITLDLEEVYDEIVIEVRDINGKHIRQRSYYQTKRINFQINDLANGVYFIYVQQPKATRIFKFVVD